MRVNSVVCKLHVNQAVIKIYIYTHTQLVIQRANEEKCTEGTLKIFKGIILVAIST